MRKNIVVGAIICLLIFSYALVSANESENNWSLIGEEHYSLIKTSNNDNIMIKHLQDKDYDAIEEKLVDASKPALSQRQLDEISKNPEAIRVDNILPNGKIMKENWEQIMENEINSMQEIRMFDDSRAAVKDIKIVKNDQSFALKKVQLNSNSILIPSNPNGSEDQYTFSGNGEKTFFYNNDGIWMADSNTESMRIVSLETDEKINQFRESFNSIYESSNFTMYDSVVSDNQGNNIAFVSKKNDFKSGRNAVFMIDTQTNNETLLAFNQNANYFTEKWLNDDKLLCLKFNEKSYKYILLDKVGFEYDLELKGEAPYIYSTLGSKIAYASEIGDEVIHIIEILKDGSLNEISSIKTSGKTRVRQGINGFSPDASKFAVSYIDSGFIPSSYVKVVDLKSNEEILINKLPKGEEYILECSWIDNDSLLIVTGKQNGDSSVETSWVYYLVKEN